jgi:hypothetical protein
MHNIVEKQFSISTATVRSRGEALVKEYGTTLLVVWTHKQLSSIYEDSVAI